MSASDLDITWLAVYFNPIQSGEGYSSEKILTYGIALLISVANAEN
jgi:hypothetical protein